MKKIISKILIILIIFLLLFDFIFASQYRCVYAAGGPGKMMVEGVTNLAGGIVAIIYTLLKALIVGLTYGVQVLTTVTASVEGVNTDGNFFNDTFFDPITPVDIFFNKYKLLDINFFDFNGLDENSYIYLFRVSVAEWYAIMRLIACAILLVILLYVGIRMALSTIADDKAKYKKMLADWVVSLVLIFVLQYIIIFTVYCNNAIVNALKAAFSNNEMSTLASESIIKIGIQGIVNAGIISFASVLVYIFIVFQTIIFLLAYMKRMVKVGFLIIISPLISITYSIDKMGDGKAQALGNWLKEFVYTILIQPFHCIMYLALVETAINLLSSEVIISDPLFDIAIFNSTEYNQLAAGVLAIMCLKFINDGEQIVRKIFGFQDDGSTGMGAGAALGLAAIANAQKIGGATRKGINKANATRKKFGEAIGKDLKGFKETKSVQFASKAASKIGEGASKLGNSFANTKVGQKATQLGNTIGKGATMAGNAIGNGATKIGNGVAEAGKWVASRGTVKKAAKIGRKIGNGAGKVGRGVGKGASWVKGKAIKGANSKVGKYLRRKASLSTALGIMGAAMAYSSGNKSALDAVATGTAVQKGTQEFFGSSTGRIASEDADMHAASEELAYKQQIDDKVAEDGKGFSDNARKAIAAYAILDNYSKKQEEIDNRKKELENFSGSDEDKEKLEQEISKLEQEKSDMSEDVEQAKKDIEIYDIGKNLAGYGENDFESWKENAENSFYSKEAIEARFKARRNAPSTKSLDDIKNQIIEQLREVMKQEKGGDSPNELTVDEEATISSTAQLLMDKIALGTLNKKGFGQEEQKKLIVQQLGLQKDGANYLYEGITNFSRATERCAELSRQGQIAANHRHVRSYDETKTDIASDTLIDREIQKYIRTQKISPIQEKSEERRETADEG